MLPGDIGDPAPVCHGASVTIFKGRTFQSHMTADEYPVRESTRALSTGPALGKVVCGPPVLLGQ